MNAALQAPVLTKPFLKSFAREAAIALAGSLYLAVLSQVRIPLLFTPVPITGQTFGVATLALLLGSRRSLASFGLYLIEGAAGLPVFASLQSGILLGSTSGYLVGMAASSWVIGKFRDLGLTRTFRGAFVACVSGSACVFTFGLIGLSFFVPLKSLLVMGLLPFLAGDLVKNTLAATAAASLAKADT
ncbi:MAG: biotin transporter BioY [Cryobacterium sp.]|nr:biotin transporter BioY [Oligoflexia bacterium]